MDIEDRKRDVHSQICFLHPQHSPSLRHGRDSEGKTILLGQLQKNKLKVDRWKECHMGKQTTWKMLSAQELGRTVTDSLVGLQHCEG